MARRERLFGGYLFVEVLFEDVKGVSMVVLHADRTQDRTHGARCTSLFSNDFPYVPWSNAESQNSTFFTVYSFDYYRSRVIHQSLSDLGD